MMQTGNHGHERGYDVELHRNRGALVLPLVCVLGGAALLLFARDGAVLHRIVGGGGVLLGGVVLAGLLRPFRFAIGTDGLTVRLPKLRRLIRWHEIDALALDQPPAEQGRPASPRLLLVPAPGADLGLPTTGHHPRDGRAAVELLDLDRVREKPAEIAAALARHGGDRFVDVLGLRQAAFDTSDFTVGLRGYQPDRVDALIRRGQDALVWGGTLERQAARSEIERARAEGLPVAGRGYNTTQVDTALARLSGALTGDPSTDRRPTT
ncbi:MULTISPECIES: hypothetical protein [Micromonospora]|uniref:hypothetical protein n=1 Tax=Micromonospora TaxID=1873 RepID=UPI000D6ECEE3|nr:hypothetical protein [Micromonospora sp. S4605]PWU50276.1 hypothetical protein DLJ47_24450 [Micromonospora sp. S4605]